MIGCNRVVLTKYTIENSKIPKSFHGYRIVMLSDLHNNLIGNDNGRIIELIDRVSPDMILCAGDMIVSNEKNLSKNYIAEELMLRLADKYRILYGNGNHESKVRILNEKFMGYYEKYETLLGKAGIEFINNKTLQIDKNGESINISGYELDLEYYKKAVNRILLPSEVKKKFPDINSEKYNIMIAHNPVYFNSYAEAGADLVVSGHIHGGILRFPFVGGVFSPQIKFFPKYDKGYYECGASQMVLGAGLGTHTIPLRFNNPPEVVLIELSNKNVLQNT